MKIDHREIDREMRRLTPADECYACGSDDVTVEQIETPVRCKRCRERLSNVLTVYACQRCDREWSRRAIEVNARGLCEACWRAY